MGKRLYVGNLPYDANEAALTAAFSEDGRKVERVNVVLDRETGRPRGFAFVEMATDEDAKKAIAAMDGAQFGGRSLRVNEAEDRRTGGGRPGGGPGGFSSGPRPPGGAGVGGAGRPRTFDDPPRTAKKWPERKNTRRKDDNEEDFGGRRGGRGYDDEEE